MDAYQENSPIDDTSTRQADNNETTKWTMDNVLLTEPMHTAGTLLQNLNEDCLLEIFSSKSLTPLDLCSLAETCKRFKRITQRVFPKEFKIVVGTECDYYTREYKFQLKNYSESHKSVKDIGRILTNFGSYLSALKMHDNDPIVTNLVAQYCDGGSLKRIDIFAIGIIADLRVKFNKIFKRLQALSLNGVYTEYQLGGAAIQLNCDSLLELEVVYVDCCSAILMNTFPKLERFSFKQFDYKGSDTLLKFIGRHKSLKALEWYTGFSIHFRNDFACAIGNGCQQLEQLTLKSCQNHATLDLSTLHSLTKLKMLDVEIFLDDYNQLVTLLQALKSLEIVKISATLVRPELIAALSQLEHLRELHLISCFFSPISWSMLSRLTKLRLVNNEFSTKKLLKMIVQLTNLEELEIYSWESTFVLNESLYLKINEIVEQRSNELTLKCRFKFSKNFSATNVNKNRKVKLIQNDAKI